MDIRDYKNNQKAFGEKFANRRNGVNFMLKPPKNLKCPICGKKCYLHERTGNYACIDSNCDFAVGLKGILPKII